MAIIRRTRTHTGDFFQRRALDAFTYVGEECLIINFADVMDNSDLVYDHPDYDDVYGEISKTEFNKQSLDKLVLEYYRCWAIITSPDRDMKQSKEGITEGQRLRVQTEPQIPLRKSDMLVRFDGWEGDRHFGEARRYSVVGPVHPATIRDGSYSSGRVPGMGQSFEIVKVGTSHPYYQWTLPTESSRYREGALTEYYNEGGYGLGEYGDH